MSRITPQEFADNYKEGITNDLQEVIESLDAISDEAEPALRDLLKDLIKKLRDGRKIMCDVPPPCSGP